MDYRIIGIMVTPAEKTVFTTLYLVSDFADYNVENAIRCEGLEAVKVVTVLDCSKLKVNDTVALTYAPSSTGKTRLVAITLVED